MNTEDIQAQRAARRAAMPVVSAIVAELEQFKPQVIFAEERGIRVGKEPVYHEIFDIPRGYAPMRALPQEKGRK